MNYKIGFIGAGNMGSAMIRGIIKSGFDPKKIYACSLKTDDFNKLLEETGILSSDCNEDIIQISDVIILAVKPQNIKDILEMCKDKFDTQKIIVSIAASLPISFYENILGKDKKIVRVMPNTPAMILESMSAVSVNPNITDEERLLVVNIFKSLGAVEIVSEEKLNVITAISGSSPAYAFMFIEAMADGAVKMGLDKKTAYRIAAQALKGSACMVLETGLHPAQLKDNVCSPGGTTIEAVFELEKNGFRNAVMQAVVKCTEKADELSKNQ